MQEKFNFEEESFTSFWLFCNTDLQQKQFLPVNNSFLSNRQVLKLTLCFGLEWTQVIYFPIVKDIFSLHYLRKTDSRKSKAAMFLFFVQFLQSSRIFFKFFTTIFLVAVGRLNFVDSITIPIPIQQRTIENKSINILFFKIYNNIFHGT